MMWFEREYSWFTETLLSLLHYWNKFENEVCALKHLTLRWPEPGALVYSVFQVRQKDIMESKSPQSAPDIFFNWNEITGGWWWGGAENNRCQWGLWITSLLKMHLVINFAKQTSPYHVESYVPDFQKMKKNWNSWPASEKQCQILQGESVEGGKGGQIKKSK